MKNRAQQNKILLEIQKNREQSPAPTVQIMFDLKKGEPVAILVTSWVELETVHNKHGFMQKLIEREFGSRGMTAKITSLQHIWGIWQVSENDTVKYDFHRQENGDHPAAQKYTWCEITYEMKNATHLILCHRCHKYMCEHDQDVCGHCEQ